MNYTDSYLSEEHRLFQETLRRFVEKEIYPIAEEYEEKQEPPLFIVKKMGEAGFLGAKVPVEYGGAGMDTMAITILNEELARGSAGIAATILAHVGLALGPVNRLGTHDQKLKYLVPGVKGEKIGAFGLTEPGGGSDVVGMKTTAVRKNGKFVINGSKTFITNGNIADFVVLAAKTDQNKKAKGISLFVIEKGTPGYTTGQKLRKIGWHASDTAELFFENCEVPEENLLGQENLGFVGAMETLLDGRIGFASFGLGVAQRALEEAVKFAKEREAFGQSISQFQSIQFMMADMATQVDAARLMIRRAAWMRDQGMRCVKEASMAKLFSSEICSEVTRKAAQIHGGYGFMREYPVSRCYCDARIQEVGEGTSEVQRMLIARELGL